MANLKPYYDGAVTAEAEKNAIMAQIDAAFAKNTPEGVQEALALRPSLDAAATKYDGAQKLYISMRDASLQSENFAADFVQPVDPENDGLKTKNELTRAEFQKLDHAARAEFLKNKGTVTPEGGK